MADPALQRLLLKQALSLPTPILRGITGGGVVYRGGRTLDPHLQFLAYAARREPPLSTLTPEEARLAAAERRAVTAGRAEPDVTVETLTIDGPRGPIPARLYKPPVQDHALPVMAYFHPGGGVVGDLDAAHAFCSILAKTAQLPVVSADYAKAPEHRFPAGLEDALAAYRWTRDNAARFGAPEGMAAVGGEALGAAFAAAVAQACKAAGEPQPALQLLVCPVVDMAGESASTALYADAWPLSRATLQWSVGHYLKPEDDPADPRLSPIRSPDLTGLAPAVVATAGFDPLLDQGEAYARALAAAGVRVTYRSYDNLAHGFPGFMGLVPAAAEAAREIAGLVWETLAGVA